MALMSMRRFTCISVIVIGAGAAAACGGAGQDEEAAIPDGMGAIVASLEQVPADTQCVVVHTSNSHVSEVARDVVPLQPAQIRLGPLSPGYLYLWGEAYSVPCWQRWSYPAVDAGSTAATYQTWQADQTFVYVTAGAANQAQLVFHRLSELEVNIEFQDPDAGPPVRLDGGPFDPDAGPVPAYDAGAMPTQETPN